MHSLFSAEELLVLIPNIILISIGNTFLVQVCFYLLYIFIELEVELHVFSLLVWLPYLIRNFGLCFHLCFDFEMHHERLYCPFKVILQLNHKSRKSAKFHYCKVLSPQRYRTDIKIWWYLRLCIKLIYRSFHVIPPFTFWDMRTEICEMFIYKHAETMEYVKS